MAIIAIITSGDEYNNLVLFWLLVSFKQYSITSSGIWGFLNTREIIRFIIFIAAFPFGFF